MAPYMTSTMEDSDQLPEEYISEPWDPDHLRTRFVQALLDMYRTEVSLYDDLVQIVRSVDDSVLRTNSENHTHQPLPPRHRLERHGAIRLGTPHEMRTISRLFAVLGMHPVGYYDLSVPGVGFPLHGTAFRPTTEESLRKNPFRVFTTVLRPDLITSDKVRKTATQILQSRNLFSPTLLAILDKIETNTSSATNTITLTPSNTQTLISKSFIIFK